MLNKFCYSKNTIKSIILIERKSGFVDRGASRRIIKNHQELKKEIRNYCSQNDLQFNNVKLEFMPFVEQFKLFNQNSILIGQHGARLTNAMWLAPGRSSVIELAHKTNRNHFSNFCKDFEIGYIMLWFDKENKQFPPEIIKVDINQVLKILDIKFLDFD